MTGPFSAFESFIFNAFNITGRTTRGEYWWAVLVLSSLLLAGAVFDFASVANTPGFEVTYNPLAYFTPWLMILTFVPQMTLCARRLHDSGKTAMFYLVSLIPIVGPFLLLVMMCAPSEPRHNRWGSPRDTDGSAPVGSGADSGGHDPKQSYKILLSTERPPSAEEAAIKRAEIQDYYRTHVLKQAQA